MRTFLFAVLVLALADSCSSAAADFAALKLQFRHNLSRWHRTDRTSATHYTSAAAAAASSVTGNKYSGDVVSSTKSAKNGAPGATSLDLGARNVPSGQQKQKIPLDVFNSRVVTSHETPGTVGKRFAILGTGCFIGVGMFFPSIMMADSGTPEAISTADMCVATCALFVVGGCVGGFITGQWTALLPAILSLALTFIIGS
jgi:hypothetical protein